MSRAVKYRDFQSRRRGLLVTAIPTLIVLVAAFVFSMSRSVLKDAKTLERDRLLALIVDPGGYWESQPLTVRQRLISVNPGSHSVALIGLATDDLALEDIQALFPEAKVVAVSYNQLLTRRPDLRGVFPRVAGRTGAP